MSSRLRQSPFWTPIRGPVWMLIDISRMGVHTTYNQTIKFASQGGLPRMHTVFCAERE